MASLNGVRAIPATNSRWQERNRRLQLIHASEAEGTSEGSDAESLGNIEFKSHTTEEEWRILDKKVNKYPSQRTFTAIGTGGDSFRDSMVELVSDVVGTIHVECVAARPSSGGKYLSVRVGPVWVENAEQVVTVFKKIRADERVRWFM